MQMDHHSVHISRGVGAEVSTQTPDDKLTESCIAVLKRIQEPLSCVALGRLCHADSATVYRLLSNDPRISSVRGQGLTVFSVKPK